MELSQTETETLQSTSMVPPGNKRGSSKLRLGSALKKHKLGSKLQELAKTKSQDWLTSYVYGLLKVPGNARVTADLQKLHTKLKQEKS